MAEYEQKIKRLLNKMCSGAWPVHKDGGELEKGYKPDMSVFKQMEQT